MVILQTPTFKYSIGPNDLSTTQERIVWSMNVRNSDFTFTTAGTQSSIPYCAPELIRDPRYEVSEKSDVWACACIVYEWEICSFGGRRMACSDEATIRSFIFATIPMPQISWRTLGVHPSPIPMTLRPYLAEIDGSWDIANSEFRLILHGKTLCWRTD